MPRDDHYHLGWADACNGDPRYKFQDSYLQERYDAGYNDAMNGRENKFAKLNEMMNEHLAKRQGISHYGMKVKVRI